MKNFLKDKQKKEKGVTLVEMITVLGIVSILTGIVFFNFHNTRDQFALQRSVQQLVRDIRRASEMAMGAYVATTPSPTRYGVFINKPADQQNNENERYYFLFFDQNDNGIWKEDSPDNDIKVDSRDIFYEKNIYLKEVATTPNSGANCDLNPGLGNKNVNISFKPPAPAIEIKVGPFGNPKDCQEIKLIFGIKGSNLEKAVIVNVAGLVDIE